MAKAIDYDEYEARIEESRATQALEFLTKHFVVVSAFAVVAFVVVCNSLLVRLSLVL